MSVTSTIVAACAAYAEHFGTPERVYYPGCGRDSSPSVGLPKSIIIYLDPIQSGLDEIKWEACGASVVCGKAENYTPDRDFDLVLDMHSHAPFEAEVRHIKPGGHLLIANKMSDKAFDHSSLELVAAMMVPNNSDEVTVHTENLERFLEEEPNPEPISFSNRRKIKVPFYVFRKK